MSDISKQYHSIEFGRLNVYTETGSNVSGREFYEDRNTWDDWHLIPSSRPLVNPPKPVTKRVSIPGTNDILDLSTALTGTQLFQERSGSWQFLVENGHKEWHIAYTDIMTYLHAKTCVCVLEDDPEYYYKGYFEVNGWSSGANWSAVDISYSLYPYKRLIKFSTEPWLWDPFNFETDVIREYGTWIGGKYYDEVTIPANSNLSISVAVGKEPVHPIIKCNKDLELSYNGRTYDLAGGYDAKERFEIMLFQNAKSMTIRNNTEGDATFSIKYEVGEL